ncbi:DUF6289 family protein [Micromonospora sp. NPDC050397]|uniref:DUF6289 family protein n=1 Tax=Micromonospora sp. NPDC050397 TaxID=3364279 RepID=UPI00384E53B8
MIRRVLLAAAIAVAALVVVPGTPAQARACKADHDCYTAFYSDSSHTTLVGALSESCDGTRSMWGRRSGYLTFSESPC